MTFRVGAEDAPYVAAELRPAIKTEDLVSLPNHSIYVKLMIDGTPSKPFSARTLALARDANTLDVQSARS